MWCLCDSFTGYCLAFSMNTGAINDANGLDLGYRVVMHLMSRHLTKRHHLYADNFFTSVHLAADLLQANTYLCGTTRATRREFPNSLGDVRLRQSGSAKWRNDEGVMLVKWHDKRNVFLIATNNAGDDFVRQTRRNRQLSCRCQCV